MAALTSRVKLRLELKFRSRNIPTRALLFSYEPLREIAINWKVLDACLVIRLAILGRLYYRERRRLRPERKKGEG